MSVDSNLISLFVKDILQFCLKSISGPDTACAIEVDHIIPQDAFKNNPIESNAKHSLYNLGLLPKRDNISKSNKQLIDIHDAWLIEQIKKYEFIEKSDFEKFSNTLHYKKLFEVHHNLFKSVFGENGAREEIIFK